MGIVFILTMILVKPNYSDVASGFIPSSIPEGSSVTIIAMIGTTLIGINLLMQAVTNARKWSGPEHLSDAKFDIGFNVGLGTLITLSIVITSGAVLFGTGVTVTSPIIFSAMLEPTLGVYAKMIGNIDCSSGLIFCYCYSFGAKSCFSPTIQMGS